jgi:hypothetical protein
MEAMMRVKALRAGVALAVCLVVGLFVGAATPASALEVPEGVQEVHVPITLPVSEAIAGGEIEFNQSEGLVYLRFEPASGVKNPVKATVDDKTYVGFFSSGNEFKPVDGALSMGDLVFRYTGNASEQITLSMIKLHTKVDTGTGVDTQVVNPNTIIPISRASSNSGGGDNGGDNGGGGNNNGGGGTNNNGGTNNGGTNTNNGSGTNNTGGSAVVDATNTDTGTSGVSPGGTSVPQGNDSPATNIDDVVTPLAPIVNEGSNRTTALWLGLLLALLSALLLSFLIFLFWRRRRQTEEAEEGFGDYLRVDADQDEDSPSH